MQIVLVLFAAFVLVGAQEPQPCGKCMYNGHDFGYNQIFLSVCRIAQAMGSEIYCGKHRSYFVILCMGIYSMNVAQCEVRKAR